MELKEQLLLLCKDFILKRERVIKTVISEIETSLQSETKSSAGDKHETGRAMLQLEREKAGSQLAEINKLENVLFKIDTSKTNTIIRLGSVAFTTEANYFIAISAGEINTESHKFYAISSNTPIGELLIGKSVGDEITFRDKKIKILNLL